MNTEQENAFWETIAIFNKQGLEHLIKLAVLYKTSTDYLLGRIDKNDCK